jgi:hypothetical protein
MGFKRTGEDQEATKREEGRRDDEAESDVKGRISQ